MRNDFIDLLKKLNENSIQEDALIEKEDEEELKNDETSDETSDELEKPEDVESDIKPDVEPEEEPEEEKPEEEPEEEPKEEPPKDSKLLAKRAKRLLAKNSTTLKEFGYYEYLENVAEGEMKEAENLLKNGYTEIFSKNERDINASIIEGATKAKDELELTESIIADNCN